MRWGKGLRRVYCTWAGLAVAWRVAAEGWKGSALTRKDDVAAADSCGGCAEGSGSRGRTRRMALPVPATGGHVHVHGEWGGSGIGCEGTGSSGC